MKLESVLAFHFNTKRKFVLPQRRQRRVVLAAVVVVVVEKEIYVHYRLFLSDDVNFVAFLAFAAAKQPSSQARTSFCCALYSECVYMCVYVCVFSLERKL